MVEVLKSFLNWLQSSSAIGEVLQSRVDEVIELKRRQERVNNMLIDELIGFPVPQEHRKELNDKLNTYLKCDRTTLISLLLQHDWNMMELMSVAKNGKKNPQYI